MRENFYPGKYIMLEGGEGGGKTTQAALLAKRLADSGFPVLAVKEPDAGNVFGKIAYAIYACGSDYSGLPEKLAECASSPRYEFVKAAVAEAGKVHIEHLENIMREAQDGDYKSVPLLLQLAMIFSRLELLTSVVIPKLKEGTHVVSDRGFLSTLAYGLMDGLDWSRLLEFHEYVLGENFITPNLAFIFDVSPELGLERTLKKQRGVKERHDTLEILRKVRAAYATLSAEPVIKDNLRIVGIDGSRSEAAAHADIWAAVQKLIAS